MAYIQYYDNRFGDLYEIYTDDVTGEFEMAMRSVGAVGREAIYYGSLEEIPQPQRNRIEHIIWTQSHPKPKSLPKGE